MVSSKKLKTYANFIRPCSEEVLEAESLEPVGDDLVKLRGRPLFHFRLGLVIRIQIVELELGRVEDGGGSRVDLVDLINCG